MISKNITKVIKTPRWALKKLARRVASSSLISDAACPSFSGIPRDFLVSFGYCSQNGQDYLVDRILLGEVEGGVFVDVGAHDGRNLSNSYFFESVRDWTGLCIEPNPDVYRSLIVNRKCQTEQVAIGETFGIVEFEVIEGSDMLSGVAANYNWRHRRRISETLEAINGRRRIIEVESMPLQSLLEVHGIDHIDLLSIDTEGSELSVLKGLDFQRTHVSVIVIERNYESGSVPKFLKSKGFNRLMALSWDDIYVREDLMLRL